MGPFFPAVWITLASATISASLNIRVPNIVSVEVNGPKYDCRCSPEDACWPDKAAWDGLNATVNGNLLRHIPPAAVCYNEFRGIPTYNKAACDEATSMWKDERWQISRPASVLWTWGSNNTCELTTDPSASCTMGYYPEFVIMAKTRDHIKAGVDFARSRNIRLVMRNTGHDFESRSAGASSLAINTHSFKDISFTDKYDGPGGYRGPTITIGAGVQGYEVIDAAHAQNPPRLVVTGECATVGVAGGFIQGGGHGPLTSLHGFAADNALSFEVLTASGNFITANAKSNPDLFWALKGGGPGTFAVVLSVTMKTYLDNTPTAGLFLNVNASTGATFSQAQRAAGIINEHANYMVDNGLYAIYELYAPAISGALHVQPIMGFNLTAKQLRTTVAPLFKALDDEKIPYNSGFLEYSDFYSIYHDIFEPEQAAQNGLTGGWVFTHKDMRPENQGAVADAIALALSPRSDMLGIVIGHIFDPGHTMTKSQSATHPRWRGATIRFMSVLVQPLDATWKQKLEYHDVMANVITEKYKQAAPNGLAYVNENYAFMNNWQDAFWGENYPRLKAIKKSWDPQGVFFSPSTPGTEDWHITDYAHRLCKKL
ncbi:hypothetical protein D7B24_004954 [Verticillium nonalfalfae]|uniref:FAD-binding PCMH-type domain-containing protein n=1 Tax=Verticillium nonalfalfae TaxID=1051616 RepID=A0A3M9YCP4_9PEZI|nr:uncharacterized protein D7B24_004954 [Verticillium nonalfalfae]RNJ58313.1 hypothetical protein D7B24_004954 [Verticillium nonalfalfae]